MAFSRETVVDKIEIDEWSVVSIRRATYIVEDGVRATEPKYLRVVRAPGDDVSSDPLKVRQICQLLWTPAVIAAYQAHLAAVAAAARTPTI